MPQRFLVPINLNQNELQNAVLQNLASDPSTPVAGQMYYNTTDNAFYGYDGSNWYAFNSTAGVTELYSDAPLGVSQHTGSVTISIPEATAGDDGYMTAYMAGLVLNATAIPTGDTLVLRDSGGSAEFTTLSVDSVTINNAPSVGTDAATKAYVDGLVNGLSWLNPARAVATSNVTLLNGTGGTVDGVTLAANDRILLTAQTTASQNGLWVVQSGAWTRPADYAAGATVRSAALFVQEGTTYADTQWVLTTNGDVTVNTTNATFAQFGASSAYTADDVTLQLSGNTFSVKADGISNVHIATAAAIARSKIASGTADHVVINNGSGVLSSEATLAITRGGTGASTAAAARTNLAATTKYAANLGDGTNTSYTINHALNSFDVVIQVFEASGSRNQVFPDVRLSDVDNAVLEFAVAPTTNQYRVVITG